MSSEEWNLSLSPRKDKKYRVQSQDCTIHFGASSYSDYTLHKDSNRKDRYIARHSVNQDWGKSGICTAGFWSRWLLWNKPDLGDSIKDIEKRFKIKINLN